MPYLPYLLTVTTFFITAISARVVLYGDAIPSLYARDSNLTSLTVNGVDSRFRLVSHFTNERLPATAVLMNTVYYISEAADLDFDAGMNVLRPFTSDDYPGMMIDLENAKPRYNLPAYILVYGLYGAAVQMIAESKFVVSEFDLLWKGRIVAKLRYQKAASSGTAIKGDPGEDDQELNSPIPSNYSSDSSRGTPDILKGQTSTADIANMTLDSSSIDSTNADPEIKLHAQYPENAQLIPIWTIFVMIIATLKDNAWYKATARVQPMSTSVPGFDATLTIQTPRTRQPPYLVYKQLNIAIPLIPILMLRHSKFAEMTFQIEIGGKEYVFPFLCRVL